jgi:hypothetical protein
MSAGVENRDRSDSISGLRKPERIDSDKNFVSPALSPGLMSQQNLPSGINYQQLQSFANIGYLPIN